MERVPVYAAQLPWGPPFPDGLAAQLRSAIGLGQASGAALPIGDGWSRTDVQRASRSADLAEDGAFGAQVARAALPLDISQPQTGLGSGARAVCGAGDPQLVAAGALAAQVLAVQAVLDAILLTQSTDEVGQVVAPVLALAGLTALTAVTSVIQTQVQRLLGEEVARSM